MKTNLPVITAQDIWDGINYYKTRTRFIEAVGPVEGELACVRIGEVLTDLAERKLLTLADYNNGEVVDELFARLKALDETLVTKLQAFVFTRCERKQKLIQHHPSKEERNKRERDLTSVSLKNNLMLEKSNYIAEFKNRVTCVDLLGQLR